ncbi:hypothetical protein [Longirhabdus pacifica]|uniref:hypothetical protein n=1 Tax=Longirhabdus pacifica TaxID=2305227 RepID=UPI0010090A01|nr:hypothetical protein [Longirhabdus pacifica]
MDKEQRKDEENKLDDFNPLHRDLFEENEEFSAEVIPTDVVPTNPSDNIAREQGQESSNMIGLIAIILSISSFFMFPAVLGPAGAVVGLITYTQGNVTLGIWSIVLGLTSFVAYFILLPLFI